jgi:hypothetical protein
LGHGDFALPFGGLVRRPCAGVENRHHDLRRIAPRTRAGLEQPREVRVGWTNRPSAGSIGALWNQ